MKRSSTPLLAVWGAIFFVSLAATPGCGSSGGPTGDPAALLASCNAYCDAYINAACSPSNYQSAADCKMAECFHLPESPAICQTTIKTYYDCARAEQDICADCAQSQRANCPDMGCKDDFMAVLACQ